MNDVNKEIVPDSRKIDTLSDGLGTLVDADLAAEAARLRALQVEQQLRLQSLPIGNTAPSTLAALFK